MTLRDLFRNPASGLLRAGWRIPLLMLGVAPVFVGVSLLSRFLRAHVNGGALLAGRALSGLVLILGALAVYLAFARWVEHRSEVPELRVDRDTPWHVGLGWLLGGGTMLVIVGILAAAGSYHVEALDSPWVLLKASIFYLPQSFSEDFVFCLIFYRLLKEGLGRRMALILAPVLFSAAHMGNTHESFMGLLEIFTGGVLMYYVFDRTGSFFTVWMLHFSWNFTMNGVFGLANSGQAIPGFLHARVTGPTWFTGGATGPEASILAVGLDLLLFALIWKLSDRQLRSRTA
jgi:membrane protease YdiL (CAAX protease family)